MWEFGGLWNDIAWNRDPFLEKQSLCIQENGENLWLYKVEDAVLMVEVMPRAVADPTIGQVVLKRLLTADQVIARLCEEGGFCRHSQFADHDVDTVSGQGGAVCADAKTTDHSGETTGDRSQQSKEPTNVPPEDKLVVEQNLSASAQC